MKVIPIEFVKLKELDGHAKGTKMSISYLIAYLIGWGELDLKCNRKMDKNQNVDFPETNYKWNELGKLTQKFYSDYRDFDYKSLLSKMDNVVNQILNLVEQTENFELYEKPWYNKWTKGKMIQLNTSSPYKNARTRLKKWINLNEDKIREYTN